MRETQEDGEAAQKDPILSLLKPVASSEKWGHNVFRLLSDQRINCLAGRLVESALRTGSLPPPPNPEASHHSTSPVIP